jgi:hypothetical protein
VNYRSLNDLFAISQNRADTTTYDVKVQMIEIYNEQVRDLLMVDGANKRYPFGCKSYFFSSCRLKTLFQIRCFLYEVTCKNLLYVFT